MATCAKPSSILPERLAGCDIGAIVAVMYHEQSEHLFCKFTSAFVKVCLFVNKFTLVTF